MALKTYKPITPSLRQLVMVDRSELWKGKPVKELTEGVADGGATIMAASPSASAAAATSGIPIVDFKRRKFDMPAKVERLEYDPNRTSFIALIKYEDGEQAYIMAPQRLNVGDKVVSGHKVDVKPGNAMPMANMPIGTIVHNVELKLGKGGQIARSAGCYAQLAGRDQGMAILRLNSGEMRMVQADCMATVGAVSNPDNSNTSRQGRRKRWLGRRPSIRGVAMNPVDHPHGGGEGRTSGGRHPVTPGASRPRARDPYQQVDHQVHRDRAPQERRRGRRCHAQFGKVRSSTAICCKKAEAAAHRALRGHQDLEPALDHPAAIRRPDLRRLQRPQAHAGARLGGNGRSQVRRVLADPHLPRPRRRQEGEEGLTMSQAKIRAAPQRQRGQSGGAHASRQPAEAQSRRSVDPRQKGRRGSAELTFSRKRIASESERCLQFGDRQCGKQPRASTSTISSSPRPTSARRW